MYQDVSCPGGFRVARSIDGINPEPALFALLKVRHSDFGAWVELFCGVHPPPIKKTFFMNLDDVTLDGAATIFLWWSPGKSDAALRLVLNLWVSRWRGDVYKWNQEHSQRIGLNE